MRDLTVEKPGHVLRHLCLPLFASVIFQQLYNLADSLVVGQFVGESALAAVGNSYELTLVFIAVAQGCNIGCSVVIARLYGARRYCWVRTAIYTSLISGAVLCAVLMASGLAWSDVMLTLIHTPDDVFKSSSLYLRIYLLGLPFLFFHTIITGVFSAMGDTKTPFWLLAAASLSNIGVDLLFVLRLHMGVAGVAWATFLCQGAGCMIIALLLKRRLRKWQLGRGANVFSWQILREITRIALPSVVQQGVVSTGNVVLQGIINGFGTSVVAGYSAAVKLNNLMVSSFTTLANGISAYTAQNLGAGRTARVTDGFRAGSQIAAILLLPLMVLYLGFGRLILSLFLERAAGSAMATGLQFLRYTVPFYPIVTVKFAADGVLRGAGKMSASMLTTVLDLFIRVTFAALMVTQLGMIGIWLAWPAGWCFASAASVWCYLSLVARKINSKDPALLRDGKEERR